MGWEDTDRPLVLGADPHVSQRTAFEALVSGVELVPGAGDRFRGQLCIMSLVALLAGERHSDEPATASRFVRWFAMALNDSLPARERQRLKLFAPRIVGTNDGRDERRLWFTRRLLAVEILPRLLDDIFDDRLPTLLWSHPTVSVSGTRYSAAHYLLAFVNDALAATESLAAETIAIAVAKLLVCGALLAPSGQTTSRYIATAIDVLDRLCDISERTSFAALDASASDRQLERDFIVASTRICRTRRSPMGQPLQAVRLETTPN